MSTTYPDCYKSSSRPHRKEVRRHIFGSMLVSWEFFHNKRGFNYYIRDDKHVVEEFSRYEDNTSLLGTYHFNSQEEAEVHIDRISNKLKSRNVLEWLLLPLGFVLIWYFRILFGVFGYTVNK